MTRAEELANKLIHHAIRGLGGVLRLIDHYIQEGVPGRQDDIGDLRHAAKVLHHYADILERRVAYSPPEKRNSYI